MADSGGELCGCCCELPSPRTIVTPDLTFPIATRSCRPLFHPKPLVFNVSALLLRSLSLSFLNHSLFVAPYGAGGCCNSNSTAGCCGSCCKGFDEDTFDAQVKKDLEKTRDPNAPPINPSQPEPQQEMSLGGTPS